MMGSATDSKVALPDASSDTLVLTHPTEAEKKQTWTLNHAEWGGALSLQDYLLREPYLCTIPLSADGGMRHWILTDSSAPVDARQVLASCESLRKRALVADGKGNVREEITYGIASVYTPVEFRGRRYAGRMLEKLAVSLRAGVDGDDRPIASALWSDIGRIFYAKKGWLPFPSLHVNFPIGAQQEGVQSEGAETETMPINYDNLESICKLDEQLLRSRLAKKDPGESKMMIAMIPDYDVMRWHLFRDDFVTSLVFKGTKPSNIKGAIGGKDGHRVWALWTRSYHGDAGVVASNTMYILRLVVEDENAPQEELQQNFNAVLQVARTEARNWKLGKIELWNPDSMVKALVEGSALDFKWVERESDSIPSLMWYGEESTDQVDWVANEKYCWC